MRLHRAFPLLLIVAIAAFHVTPTPATGANDGLIVKQSDFGGTKTLDSLGIAMERNGIKVFARVNHAKGAASVVMDLAPNAALIFRSRQIGTPLMTSTPTIGLDLPLQAVASKAAGGMRNSPIPIRRFWRNNMVSRIALRSLKRSPARSTNSPIWRPNKAFYRSSNSRPSRRPWRRKLHTPC